MDQAAKIAFKAHLILGLIIATVVCIGVFVLGALGIHATWPAFFVMISFFITGADIKNLPSIFIGAIFGLVVAILLVTALTPLGAAIGELPATLLLVWIVIFIIAGFGTVVPQACNNFAFTYFTIALIEIPVIAEKAVGEALKSGMTDPAAIAAAASSAVMSNTLTWGLTAILGGGCILGAIILLITLARKAGILPPAEAAH